MKNFKQYNESVTDLLQGKSSDEIINILNNLSDNDKIKYIIKYQLDFNLLPRDINGICHYYDKHGLGMIQWNLTKLLDNFHVHGNLNIADNELTKLPKKLKVDGFLDCSLNLLTELPNDLFVGKDLYCDKNPVKLNLPKSAIVKGSFNNGPPLLLSYKYV